MCISLQCLKQWCSPTWNPEAYAAANTRCEKIRLVTQHVLKPIAVTAGITAFGAVILGLIEGASILGLFGFALFGAAVGALHVSFYISLKAGEVFMPWPSRTSLQDKPFLQQAREIGKFVLFWTAFSILFTTLAGILIGAVLGVAMLSLKAFIIGIVFGVSSGLFFLPLLLIAVLIKLAYERCCAQYQT